jgi:predicted metal-dependent phosphoesterase TrpH
VTAAAAPAVTARHIDLHLHSTASDGTNAPEVVVFAARDAGLQALALTDHDTVTESRGA